MTLVANQFGRVEHETSTRYVPLGDGIESCAITVETRREVCPTQVDPRLYDEPGVTVRVFGDRCDRSIRGDVIGYVVLTLRAIGHRLYVIANLFELRLAHRHDVNRKSPGMSDDLERELEAAALRAPGGTVVRLAD